MSKLQIALALIEQALADGVAPAPVLADSAYGDNFAFREHLRKLRLEFLLQVTPQEHEILRRRAERSKFTCEARGNY